MFIVPMDTPGITVKPATTMYDGSFANIFYDDVRIPADHIVGPVERRLEGADRRAGQRARHRSAAASC
jgi:alkylation response protein AidB-like acyl-CoA dehydrogenase